MPLVEFVQVLPLANWGLVFVRPFIDTTRVAFALLLRAVSFACFDRRLNRAAEVLGMTVVSV